MSAQSHPQLPLPLKFDVDQTFDNFFLGKNHHVVTILQNLMAEQTSYANWLVCHGPKSCGKSHLLKATASHFHQQGYRVGYFSFDHSQLGGAEILLNMHQADLLCIDNLEVVIGQQNWELALFELLNAIYDKQSNVLVATNQPIQQLVFFLPDLKSRLNWAQSIQIKPLAEEEKKLAFKLYGNSLGIDIADHVLDFIFLRQQRDMKELIAGLKKIDHFAMMAKKPITIPLAKAALNL